MSARQWLGHKPHQTGRLTGVDCCFGSAPLLSCRNIEVFFVRFIFLFIRLIHSVCTRTAVSLLSLPGRLGWRASKGKATDSGDRLPDVIALVASAITHMVALPMGEFFILFFKFWFSPKSFSDMLFHQPHCHGIVSFQALKLSWMIDWLELVSFPVLERLHSHKPLLYWNQFCQIICQSLHCLKVSLLLGFFKRRCEFSSCPS